MVEVFLIVKSHLVILVCWLFLLSSIIGECYSEFDIKFQIDKFFFLQSDNREAAQLLESILFIIDSVLPLLRKLPQNVLEELEQDLKQMIVRHSFLTVVHACIKYYTYFMTHVANAFTSIIAISLSIYLYLIILVLYPA